MDPDPSDDMLYVCDQDGNLALTGRELRERRQRGEELSPLYAAGRVLHAWDITDQRGDVTHREFTTTQGFLVSDNEVVTNERGFAEAYVSPNVLSPEAIHEVVEDAAEETNFGGLKQKYPPEDLEYLRGNAEMIAESTHQLQPVLSELFVGLWEGTQPYLVGQNHEYRIPIKGEDAVDVQDTFVNHFRSFQELNRTQAQLLWEAVGPVLRVSIDLYIEGEQVA